ncbi:PhoX family phosphatase [Algiphilus sp.]|uniref:PhoX family protein n=1 Tax=Algiphilus sp. TaxID=1872431 RepID=UPI0025B87924|nr:PhoX family phosphatase [Algiphilus sp.]MCK5770230.1 PhoX family phosphatase [Algiphilus sp.]
MGHHPVEDHNPSSNPHIAEVLGHRTTRRGFIAGGASATGAVATLALVGCSDDNGSGGTLGFEAVPKSLEDRVTLPAGYSAAVLYAMGDPIAAGVAAFTNDGTQGDFDKRAGDQHDGMTYFGLSDDGTWDPGRADRGLLCMNHEQLDVERDGGNGLHQGTTRSPDARARAEVDNEMNAHGVSVIEVRSNGGVWEVVQDSPFNRRITGFTPMEITGPVRGSDLVRTGYSPNGTRTRGTLNNCANGYTPWGTYLTCEENWFSYFRRDDDVALRSDADNANLARYGIGPDSTGFSYRSWDTVPGDSVYTRFDITETVAGNAFANETNTFGWIVEINPFDPDSTPNKRTALGRFGHEGAWAAPAIAGEPVVLYMGDDSRGEYIYKFVSAENWDPADATDPGAGDKYLDEGTLYVCRFNEDGTGVWVALEPGSNGLDAGTTPYPFDSLAAVLVGTRLAADVVGATRMDRPEWGAVNPRNREVYMTLTNNNDSIRSLDALDGANPRTYEDENGRTGNVNGHIIRWRENGSRSAATGFQWDIFAFGASATADAGSVNISGLDDDNDFASPDGLWFDDRGLLWIQTDDSSLGDRTNNQMLVCNPGAVGDGDGIAITSTLEGQSQTQGTFVGRPAADNQLRRFLVGPTGCEITGITATPDNRTLFVNVQHPGENGEGNWPNPSRDATQAGQAGVLPRSATIVITRDDGGEIAV